MNLEATHPTPSDATPAGIEGAVRMLHTLRGRAPAHAGEIDAILDQIKRDRAVRATVEAATWRAVDQALVMRNTALAECDELRETLARKHQDADC